MSETTNRQNTSLPDKGRLSDSIRPCRHGNRPSPERANLSIISCPSSGLCFIAFTTLTLCGILGILCSRGSKTFLSTFSPKAQHATVLPQISTASRVSWEGQKPSFCKSITDNPTPQHKNCMLEPDEMTCPRENESVTFSQYQQDYYLYTRHFVHLQRPGFYIDIGANDPVHISNTYFMDRCLGWQGICVEPNPTYLEPLYRLRSCHLVPTCVSSRDGDVVSFSIFGGWSGIVDDTYKHNERFRQENRPTITQRCTTMALIMKRNNVSVVDFMSLDVEGHEMKVLRGFQWDSVKINVMTVETSPVTIAPITEFLEARGYKRHIPEVNGEPSSGGLLEEDAIFLHADAVFGSPV